MSEARWNISGPIDFAWTPGEVAQIAQAAQAFMAALPNPLGFIAHRVSLDGVEILGGAAKVDWPQPGEGVLVNPVATKVDGTSALS